MGLLSSMLIVAQTPDLAVTGLEAETNLRLAGMEAGLHPAFDDINYDCCMASSRLYYHNS